MSLPRVLLILALLAIVAYLPTLWQPLLEDDYPHITLAQHLGDPANWRELAVHPFRFRATAEWFLWAGYALFGLHAAGYYAVTILLHVLATWLVYAMGAWPLLGYELSAWAAGFFAIYEGHQEAVMWVSACNELWQFLFIAGAFVCWLHFLYGKRQRAAWYAAGLACLALALLSKESAAAFVVLLALPLTFDREGASRLPALCGGGGSWALVALFDAHQFVPISGWQLLHSLAVLADPGLELRASLLDLGPARAGLRVDAEPQGRAGRARVGGDRAGAVRLSHLLAADSQSPDVPGKRRRGVDSCCGNQQFRHHGRALCRAMCRAAVPQRGVSLDQKASPISGSVPSLRRN